MTNPYTPAGQAQNITPTVTNIGQGISNLQPYTAAAQSTVPQATSTEQGLYANPYAGVLQGGAATAQQMGQTAAQNQFGTGGQITQAGMGLLPYGQQVAQMGLDPQQALFNRLLPQVYNAYNVANQQAGVGNTPYGAATTGQGVSDFMLNWQNQQLGRGLQGLQGAESAVSGAGQAGQLGSQLQAQAAPQFLQSAAYPFATAEQIGGSQNQAIQQLLQQATMGANIGNLPTQDLLTLLSGLNQANTVFNVGQQGAADIGLRTAAGFGQGLGSGLGWLSGSGPSNLASGLGSLGSWAASPFMAV